MFSVLTSYLDNGLKIMLRSIPNQRTVSCGVWVNQGVKDEDSLNNGISHLVEHLMFKINSNNSKHNMQDNLEELKLIGARYNATTIKDQTYFYIDGLSRDINKLLEILSYIVVNKQKVSDDDLKKEKDIVLREAETYLASSKQITERVGQALWGNHSFGQLVIGNPTVIKSITNEMVDEVIANSYIPENCVLVVVGGFEYNPILDEIYRRFGNWVDKDKRNLEYIIQSEPGIFIDNKFSGTRSTIGIGFQAFPSTDRRSRYTELLKDILSRPGSRLFNEIREKRGLIYSLNGFATSFSSAGNMGIAFSANNNDVPEIIKICIDEFRLLIDYGIDSMVLENVKRVRETDLLYGIESTSNQLNTIGKSSIRGNLFLLEDEMRELTKINKETMDKVVREVFLTDNLCMAVLGKVDVDKLIPILEF
jgi:predicted Zn-dependent peptidase